jgi:hypothetical protein
MAPLSASQHRLASAPGPACPSPAEARGARALPRQHAASCCSHHPATSTGGPSHCRVVHECLMAIGRKTPATHVQAAKILAGVHHQDRVPPKKASSRRLAPVCSCLVARLSDALVSLLKCTWLLATAMLGRHQVACHAPIVIPSCGRHHAIMPSSSESSRSLAPLGVPLPAKLGSASAGVWDAPGIYSNATTSHTFCWKRRPASSTFKQQVQSFNNYAGHVRAPPSSSPTYITRQPPARARRSRKKSERVFLRHAMHH